MKPKLPLLALALVLASPLTAVAATLDGLEAVNADAMESLRGGTETEPSVLVAPPSGPEVAQGNVSSTDQTNVTGGTTISGHSAKLNGAIGTASITGNHGIVTQMINSGDNNLMSAPTNINIYMK